MPMMNISMVDSRKVDSRNRLELARDHTA